MLLLFLFSLLILVRLNRDDDSPRFGLFDFLPSDEAFQVFAESTSRRTAVRLVVLWENLEPSPFEYIFDEADNIVSLIEGKNVDLFITLFACSTWATVYPWNPEHASGFTASFPKNLTHYQSLVEKLVTRYQGRIKFWQFENEVYLDGWFWNGTMEEYKILMNTAFETVKNIDPDSIVTLAGFSHGFSKQFVEGQDPDVSESMEYLLTECDYDAVDQHYYDTPSDLLMILDEEEGIRQFFPHEDVIILSTEIGDLDVNLIGKHVLLDEYVSWVDQMMQYSSFVSELELLFSDGINDEDRRDVGYYIFHDSDVRPISEKYQATNLVKRMVLTQYLGLMISLYLCLTDEDPETSPDWYMSTMCLATVEGRKKPSFYVYSDLISLFENTTWSERHYVLDEEEEEDIYIFEFRDERSANKEQLFVLWLEKNGTDVCEVDLSLYCDNFVSAVRIVTELTETGDPIYPQVILDMDVENVQLDDIPLYVNCFRNGDDDDQDSDDIASSSGFRSYCFLLLFFTLVFVVYF